MIRIPSSPLSTLNLTALVLLVTGLAACDTGDKGRVVGYGPDDNLIEETANQSVHPVFDTENNRLIFKGQEHFDDFMQGMSEVYTTHVGLDILENELEFQSLRRQINHLRRELAESPENDSVAYAQKYAAIDALDIIEDPLFATVLNPDGEIQIGETVHKVGKTFVHSVHASHEHLLDEVDNYSEHAFQNEHVDVFSIKGKVSTLASGKVTVPDWGSDESTCRHRYNGNRYRINGKSWIKSYSMYASSGTQTYHYKRINIFGGYSKRAVNYIAVTTTVNLYHSSEHGSEYINYTDRIYDAYESSGVFKSFIYGRYANYGVNGTIDSYHGVRRSNGTVAGCSTDVSYYE